MCFVLRYGVAILGCEVVRGYFVVVDEMFGCES